MLVSSSIILHITALRQGLSPKWKLIILARPTDQGSLRIHLFLSLQIWGPMLDEVMSNFSMWVVEIWTQTWVLAEQPCLLRVIFLVLKSLWRNSFLDEIVVGASFSLGCETRLSLPILWQHLGGMAREPSSKMLCHASLYEARGKGPDVSVSGFLDLWNDYWHPQSKGSYSC